MNTTRYSKSNVVKTLNDWIVSVTVHGLYSKSENKTVHLKSIDAGMVDGAKDLLEHIKNLGSGGLTKKNFKKLVEDRWEVACTLPVNKYLFNDNTGYSQVVGKSEKICFQYGKYNFDVNVVYSVFCHYL